MNYLPSAGYWFYGGSGAYETASFYSSYGLLDNAPSLTATNWFYRGLGFIMLKMFNKTR